LQRAAKYAPLTAACDAGVISKPSTPRYVSATQMHVSEVLKEDFSSYKSSKNKGGVLFVIRGIS